MPFDFEKLIVYQKSKDYNCDVSQLIETIPLSRNKKDQFERAAFSIMLNIAEGSGRYTKPDRRNFYVISRGFTFECVAIIDFLRDKQKLSEKQYNYHYQKLEEISKMLFALIQGLK